MVLIRISSIVAICCIILQVWHTPIKAQWSGQSRRTMHRGLIAHSIFNPGMSGKRDNIKKQTPSSFSYPMGRNLAIYSGGAARDGWNAKSNSAGEGIWILSKTNGIAHVSAAGSEMATSDVKGLAHTPASEPEGYVGVVHHENYALGIRTSVGREVIWTDLNIYGAAPGSTNWWPASGGIDRAPNPKNNQPVTIWNYRYGRYNSSTPFRDRIASGELAQTNLPTWAETLSENDFPESIAISRAESKETGLRWTRKWYQWGQADYNDFLINETVVENTSNQTAEGVYIVLQNRFWQQQGGGWREDKSNSALWNGVNDWSSDDHARSTIADNYLKGVSHADFLAGLGKPAGAQIGKDLANRGHLMLYAHDGESLHFTNTHTDVGDPYLYGLGIARFRFEQSWIREGYMNHTQYFGVGVIDALPPFNTYGGADLELYVNPHDNPQTELDESSQQPASTTIWRYWGLRNFSHPSPLNDSNTFIYDTLSQAGYHAEPSEAAAYSHFLTFGPYNLNPGEKCKVVITYVGGQGSNAPKYADYKRYPQPFNFGWMNLFGGTDQGDVSFKDRQPDIPLGEDAMFEHFQRAIDLYDWDYDTPNQPPNIKLAFENTIEGNTQISWSSFGEESPDPDYEGAEAQDIQGYRIYRSRTQYQGPWEYITEFSLESAQRDALPDPIIYNPQGVFHTIPTSLLPNGIPLRKNKYLNGLDQNAGSEITGVYQFTDLNSRPGFPYWYSVRYYDSGHLNWKNTGKAVPALESAPGPSGGAVLGRRAGVKPQIAGSAIFDRLEKQIRIVPNPFKLGDPLHTYPNTANIRFVNLPGRCQIDIYAVDGTHALTLHADDLTKGEFIWTNYTKAGPTAPAPGAYFWKVTSLMPQSMGQVQKGTMIVIK